MACMILESCLGNVGPCCGPVRLWWCLRLDGAFKYTILRQTLAKGHDHIRNMFGPGVGHGLHSFVARQPRTLTFLRLPQLFLRDISKECHIRGPCWDLVEALFQLKALLTLENSRLRQFNLRDMSRHCIIFRALLGPCWYINKPSFVCLSG